MLGGENRETKRQETVSPPTKPQTLQRKWSGALGFRVRESLCFVLLVPFAVDLGLAWLGSASPLDSSYKSCNKSSGSNSGRGEGGEPPWRRGPRRGGADGTTAIAVTRAAPLGDSGPTAPISRSPFILFQVVVVPVLGCVQTTLNMTCRFL